MRDLRPFRRASEHAAEGRTADDVEPDLEEVLESQHYAFEPDE